MTPYFKKISSYRVKPILVVYLLLSILWSAGYSGQWVVKRVTNNAFDEGNYDNSNNRFVWDAFDGNDWEIYYYRPYDVIEGVRFNLIMYNGNGTKHKKGGITRVGGRERKPYVRYDYEGLCYFNLEAFTGTVKKAQLLLFFEDQKSMAEESEKQSDTKCLCPPKKIVVYNQNKGLWNPKTVHYNTFDHCPWTEKIGTIEIKNFSVTRAKLENDALRDLVQNWVNNTASNKGLVLTSDLDDNGDHFKVKRVVLIVYFNEKIMQLTNNDIDEYDPKISKYFITWGAYDDTQSDIFFWNGFKTIQLTDTEFDEYDPNISRRKVVWEGYDGNDWDIYLRSACSVVKISQNEHDDYKPRIDNGNVVWYGYDGTDDEIFYYNGQTTVQVTNNNYFDRFPEISGSRITWQGKIDADNEIFTWKESGTILQITDNDYDEAFPVIDKNSIVWRLYDGNDWEIIHWNANELLQVTDNMYDDVFPDVSRGIITWSGLDGNDYEIYYADSMTSGKITNNDHHDERPVIFGNKILWSAYQYDSVTSQYDFDLYAAVYKNTKDGGEKGMNGIDKITSEKESDSDKIQISDTQEALKLKAYMQIPGVKDKEDAVLLMEYFELLDDDGYEETADAKEVTYELEEEINKEIVIEKGKKNGIQNN